jgi:hypothetical protein
MRGSPAKWDSARVLNGEKSMLVAVLNRVLV